MRRGENETLKLRDGMTKFIVNLKEKMKRVRVGDAKSLGCEDD